LAIQIGRQIRRLEDQLANLERKRKSTAEEVEIFTARHEVAHNEEVGITRASLNAAESALKDLDDQIKALKDQIEHLRKKV
jgi:predicted  nucleic acid-binding Zn-ribbon protein